MKILSYIARVKYRALRLSHYITIFNTVVLVTGFGWKWWYILFVFGAMLAYWFEVKHGVKGEMDVAWGSSAEWRKFREEFDELKRNLEKSRCEPGEKASS